MANLHYAHNRDSTRAGLGQRRARGFTLLELMIVVIVIAILAILAVSSYQFANVKARRSAAKGCLQESAQFMERFYTTNMKYDEDSDGNAVPAPTCSQDVTPYYDVHLVAADLSATTYTLEAVPQGAQKDPSCGTLSLDNTGKKGATGTSGDAGCW